jgi:pimeloyl-ACP methyl ester carboxylesterase
MNHSHLLLEAYNLKGDKNVLIQKTDNKAIVVIAGSEWTFGSWLSNFQLLPDKDGFHRDYAIRADKLKKHIDNEGILEYIAIGHSAGAAIAAILKYKDTKCKEAHCYNTPNYILRKSAISLDNCFHYLKSHDIICHLPIGYSRMGTEIWKRGTSHHILAWQ